MYDFFKLSLIEVATNELRFGSERSRLFGHFRQNNLHVKVCTF